MAQVGSAVNTSLNARIEAPNSNECNKATARSNRGATAGSHEVGKCTGPGGSREGCGWSCASARALAGKTSEKSETTVALLIGPPTIKMEVLQTGRKLHRFSRKTSAWNPYIRTPQ